MADCCDECVGSASVSFNSLSGWFRVDTVAALRGVATASTNTMAVVADDQTGVFVGLYAWDATSSAADNGTTIIKPDDAGAGAGRWRRFLS